MRLCDMIADVHLSPSATISIDALIARNINDTWLLKRHFGLEHVIGLCVTWKNEHSSYH